ncbi:uncharacterized protein B0H18DRAFT_973495 [Fomitopsis serialis]|uniref:uncharacterized protein n=1 Tax=Fomitopsis serialis TaxID=139415 RepID=UPI002008D6B2|nr:uncharacterized protein B0H18DRAFT_973495 [Neoantrodia serialis]KAH9936348.1 hypothetical protein B0H18DRAFT_973495 [Neoantrodia serialis]
MPTRRYSKFIPPNLSMSELVCQKLDNDATDLLIDKWLERPHSPDAYYDWFQRVRERRHAANANICKEQILLWSKGVFVPENIFTRTVDTGRLIPLDRTWVTHVYHHHSMSRLNMMPVIFSMLPELMLLRGMHDRGCDEIYVIVTDLKRQEMDQITEYFKYVCRNAANGACKSSVEEKINHDHMTLTHMLDRNRRTPCFPQIDLTLRAILYEKRPPFVVLFSHQTIGCPNPGCTDNCCELIRFPKQGLETAAVLCDKRKVRYRYGRRAKPKELCNWIDWGSEGSVAGSSEGSDGSVYEARFAGLICSRCKLVKYCSPDHQKLDWEEHRRVCVKPGPAVESEAQT